MAELRGNVSLPAGPLDQLNDPGEVFRNPAQVEFVRTLVRFIRNGFSRSVMRDQAAPSILLASPGGRVFKVTVSDDGEVATEHVQG
jgi:hypothetical protein